MKGGFNLVVLAVASVEDQGKEEQLIRISY